MTKANLNSSSPNISLAIWEVTYQNELKKYWKIVEDKARYIKKLEAIDLFSLSDSEAKKAIKRMSFLRKELEILVGYKQFIDELKEAYINNSIWLSNYLEDIEEQYFLKNKRLINKCQINYESFLLASKREQQFLATIISIIEELQARKISLKGNHFEIWG